MNTTSKFRDLIVLIWFWKEEEETLGLIHTRKQPSSSRHDWRLHPIKSSSYIHYWLSGSVHFTVPYQSRKKKKFALCSAVRKLKHPLGKSHLCSLPWSNCHIVWIPGKWRISLYESGFGHSPISEFFPKQTFLTFPLGLKTKQADALMCLFSYLFAFPSLESCIWMTTEIKMAPKYAFYCWTGIQF